MIFIIYQQTFFNITMKRKDYSALEEEYANSMKEQDQWITLIRNFQKDAKYLLNELKKRV